MPALVNSSVGSSWGTTLEEGTKVWPCFLTKKSMNCWRTSLAVTMTHSHPFSRGRKGAIVADERKAGSLPPAGRRRRRAPGFAGRAARVELGRGARAVNPDTAGAAEGEPRMTPPLSRCGGRRGQLRDERRVLGACGSLLHHREDAGEVAAHQGGGVEPQPGEHLAAQHPARAGRQPLVAALAQDEPVHLSIQHPPDDVLADP